MTTASEMFRLAGIPAAAGILRTALLAPVLAALVSLASCMPDEEYSLRGRSILDDVPIVQYPEKRSQKRVADRAPKSRIISGRKIPISSFDEFLSQPEERVDYSLGAFLFAKIENPSLSADEFLDSIEDAVFQIRRRLRKAETGPGIVDAINEYVFFEQGFRFDSSDPEGEEPDNLYMDGVLRRKKGYCVSLSLLYLCIAQKLGAPVYGVRIPSHFIVRYDDGRDVVNIETTDHGLANPNSYYSSKYRISKGSVERGVYLVNLRPKQVFVDLLNNRGTLLGMNGETAAAVKVFDAALEIDSKAASVHYNRGVMNMRMHRIEDAVKDFKTCLELDDNHCQSLVNLSEIHRTAGDLDVALEEVNRAINIIPSYSNGYVQRGLILLDMGRKQLALENMDRAIDIDGRNASAYIQRAKIHRNGGDFKKAVIDLNSACTLSPSDSMCFAERGLVHFMMGMHERAIEDFDEAVKLDSRVVEYYLNRGLVKLKAGDRKGAREDFDSALEISPENPSALAKRAAVEILDKEYGKALDFLERAVCADRDNVPALLNRGVVYFRLGRYGEAAADLSRCIHLNPNEIESYKYLGLSYCKTGDTEKASYFLGKYASMAGSGLDPEAAEAMKKLGK